MEGGKLEEEGAEGVARLPALQQLQQLRPWMGFQEFQEFGGSGVSGVQGVQGFRGFRSSNGTTTTATLSSPRVCDSTGVGEFGTQMLHSAIGFGSGIGDEGGRSGSSAGTALWHCRASHWSCPGSGIMPMAAVGSHMGSAEAHSGSTDPCPGSTEPCPGSYKNATDLCNNGESETTNAQGTCCSPWATALLPPLTTERRCTSELSGLVRSSIGSESAQASRSTPPLLHQQPSSSLLSVEFLTAINNVDQCPSSAGGALSAPGGCTAAAVPPLRDMLSLLALYLSAVIHDFDHRGVNNQFLVRLSHPLAFTLLS